MDSYMKKLLDEDKRVGERKLDEFRDIKIEVNPISSAEGSAKVSIGKTKVMVGVKMSVMDPFPDTPDEGILMVGAELGPIASPEFELGPPGEDAIELARVVDRGIRESNTLDVEKLCIEAGKKVWCASVDIEILDHDGNLIDAAGLATLVALLNTKMPEYDPETGKIDITNKKNKLLMKDKPVPVSVSKLFGKLVVDTNLEEEKLAEARVTITTTDKGDLCAMQKGGEGYFTVDELKQAVELSIKKGKELRKLI